MRCLKALVVAALAIGGLLLPANTASAAVTSVCAGNILPGYVMIDDLWDPTRCGNPTTVTNNIWIMESYFDKPVGWTMWVCQGWKPSGWAIINVTWDPTRCGNPTFITNNIWIIQRVW